jgi:uncharacterized protein with von Willebrand factor type A (vWA) domain
MARKARNQGRDGSSLATMQINLSEMLADTERKIEAAKLNSNVTEKARAKLEADKERFADALKEYDLTDEQMDIVHQGADATKEYAEEQRQKQADKGDNEETVVATKKKTRAAILGGLKSGALETAVAKMEAEAAVEATQAQAQAQAQQQVAADKAGGFATSFDNDDT